MKLPVAAEELDTSGLTCQRAVPVAEIGWAVNSDVATGVAEAAVAAAAGRSYLSLQRAVCLQGTVQTKWAVLAAESPSFEWLARSVLGLSCVQLEPG